MAQIKNLAPFILKWEGGFSNHPNDIGGATMHGVTLATYQSYRKLIGLPVPTIDDLKNITDDEWLNILRKMYWNTWKADMIASQEIANILVDWAWGSGSVNSIRQFQLSSKGSLVVDGIVGEKTLGYINSYQPEDLFNRIWSVRKTYLVNIVKNDHSQSVFLDGWLNRLFDMFTYNFTLTQKWT